jgi:hypothetical protein
MSERASESLSPIVGSTPRSGVDPMSERASESLSPIVESTPRSGVDRR